MEEKKKKHQVEYSKLGVCSTNSELSVPEQLIAIIKWYILYKTLSLKQLLFGFHNIYITILVFSMEYLVLTS